MTIAHYIAMAAAFVLICAGGATGQTKGVIQSETAPPKFVVLVYQRFPFDKATQSGKALAAAARACAGLNVPNSWIVMDSVTGEPEMLSFDPFDSFAHIGKAFAEWGPIYAAHAELGKFQAQINGALASQRTIVAERRDDLSYRANRIDLSKARFLRVLEVRLHPGHEGEFAEAFKELAAAYEKTESDLPGGVSGGRGTCGTGCMNQKVKPVSACNRSPAQRTRTQRATFTPSAPKSRTYRKSLRQAIRNSGRQNRQRQRGSLLKRVERTSRHSNLRQMRALR